MVEKPIQPSVASSNAATKGYKNTNALKNAFLELAKDDFKNLVKALAAASSAYSAAASLAAAPGASAALLKSKEVQKEKEKEFVQFLQPMIEELPKHVLLLNPEIRTTIVTKNCEQVFKLVVAAKQKPGSVKNLMNVFRTMIMVDIRIMGYGIPVDKHLLFVRLIYWNTVSPYLIGHHLMGEKGEKEENQYLEGMLNFISSIDCLRTRRSEWMDPW